MRTVFRASMKDFPFVEGQVHIHIENFLQKMFSSRLCNTIVAQQLGPGNLVFEVF